jgi:hypothetical protein
MINLIISVAALVHCRHGDACADDAFGRGGHASGRHTQHAKSGGAGRRRE